MGLCMRLVYCGIVWNDEGLGLVWFVRSVSRPHAHIHDNSRARMPIQTQNRNHPHPQTTPIPNNTPIPYNTTTRRTIPDHTLYGISCRFGRIGYKTSIMTFLFMRFGGSALQTDGGR